MKHTKRATGPYLWLIWSITLLLLVLSAANVWAKPAPGAMRWTIPTFTPTPTPDKGAVCIWVYNDQNRDRVRQPTTEELLPGAGLRLSNLSNSLVVTGTTSSGAGPFCFRELSGGTYIVRESDPPGYESTTEDAWGAVVTGNFTVTVPFGDALKRTRISLPHVLRLYGRSQ